MLPMEDRASAWFRQRSSHWRDWPVDQLLSSKRRQGLRVSVVIPAPHQGENGDRARDIAPHLGSYPAKGEALWKSLLVTQGDLLVFVDADLTRWGPHFVTGLVGPLLDDPDVLLVKGFYARVKTEHDGSTSTEGGRVTELVARPLLSLWWPELTGVVQPLAGEWAARRSLMESLSIPVGYGVELAAVLDTFSRHGLPALAQVDLGTRAHRHQSDHDLALMAAELLVVAESRHAGPRRPRPDVALHQFVREQGTGSGSTGSGSRGSGSTGSGSTGSGSTGSGSTGSGSTGSGSTVRPRVRPAPNRERPPASAVLASHTR